MRLLPLTKLLAFSAASMAFLLVGSFGAQLLWRKQHRDNEAKTGVYYSRVHGYFTSSDQTFSFFFEGQTATHWYWTFPTNFTYKLLTLEWHNYSNDSEGKATLSLPDFRYESAGSTGVLTPEILAGWLLGRTSVTSASSESVRVEQVFGYLRAAAQGTLPPPNHHGYSFGYDSEAPLLGRIQHFRLGTGIGGTVYGWFVVWGVATILLARVYFRGQRVRHQNNRPRRMDRPTGALTI